MSYNIKVEGINFSYPRHPEIISNLSLTIKPGATVLLGPNGAGKTTFINLLATFYKVNQGTITLTQGNKPSITSRQLSAYRKELAWLPQNFEPIAGLTVEEHVAYTGWLKGMGRKEAQRFTPEVLQRVGLYKLAQEKVTQLSGGQKQRLGIAGALVHHASIILLDEPSAGLDPLQRRRLQSIISDLKTDHTVLVSTHQTEDINGVYDYVIVLAQGESYFDGTLKEFIALSPQQEADPRDAIHYAFSSLVPAEV